MLRTDAGVPLDVSGGRGGAVKYTVNGRAVVYDADRQVWRWADTGEWMREGWVTVKAEGV